MTAGADSETRSENFRLQMQDTRWSPSGKETAAEGCSGTVISCVAPTVIIFLLVPGDVTLPEAGPLLPAAATTVSPLSRIFGGIYEHSALCCLLSGFGTNGDIQDVNVKTGTAF